MFSLKIYTVHVKPGVPQAEEKPVFIKEGFNIIAFVFPVLWTLFSRLWLAFMLIIAADYVLLEIFSYHMLNIDALCAVSLGIHVIVGLLGNDWRRAALKRRGYILADVAAADNLLRAEQRYFERYLAAA